MGMSGMIDAMGRNIEYLRISVTDRCNLRCIYCMPQGNIRWLEREEILTYDEMLRLCRIFAGLGISKVKLTGGEPLVRRDLHVFVRRLKEIEGIENVTLTTNGVLLAEQIDDLVKAGLDAVNISVDAFDREIFEEMTGVDGAHGVRTAIEKALAYENLRVKLNCVPIRGVNDGQWIEIASLARDHRLSVRFIEMMPIGTGRRFEAVREDELRALLEEAFGKMTYFAGKLGNGPCRYFTIEGFQGKIGFISAVSHRFCDQCNRVRLTSDGFLKTCLQYGDGVMLKSLLRGSASDDELRHCIEETVYHKPEGHHFEEEICRRADGGCAGFNTEDHQMFQIGG